MEFALSQWWTVGWIVGAVVVLLVAVLILTITGLARSISGEGKELITSLDAIVRKTKSLHDVQRTNIAVKRITRALRIVRTGA